MVAWFEAKVLADLAATAFEVGPRTVTVGGLLALAILAGGGTLLARSSARWVRRFGPVWGLEEGVYCFVCDGVRYGGALLFVLLGLHISQVLDMGDVLGHLHRLVNFTLVDVSGTPLSAASLLTLGLILLVAWWLSRLVRGTLRSAARSRGVELGTQRMLERLAHYFIMVVGVLMGLDTLGLDLGALLAAGAVVGVGVGLALQNLAQSFLAGILLFGERSIRPRDVLELQGELVRVVEIRMRTTVVQTQDEEHIIVPNASLVQDAILNHSLRDRRVRVRAQVGVAYDSDLRESLAVLTAAAATVAGRDEVAEPVALLLGFGASSVDLEVSIWIEDAWRLPAARSELLLAVWDALHAKGVVIAFPQLDVHLDELAAEGLKRLGA